MNVQDVKDILGIDHTDDDNYIKATLPLAIGFVKEYCKNDFLIDGKEVLGAVQLPIAKIIEFNRHEAGVQSEGISKVSTSFSQDIPLSILQMLEPFKKSKMRFY